MRLNENNTFIGINPPYQLSVIHSSKLIYPREIYQRGVERKRVELIARDFNEYIVNEPKVSFRNGRYYVMDGQHTIEGCILLNGGEDRPILCKVYTGLTMEQEALLFAEQNGHAAPLSAGIKLRAKVVGGDAPSKAFVAATNRVGGAVPQLRQHAAERLPHQLCGQAVAFVRRTGWKGAHPCTRKGQILSADVLHGLCFLPSIRYSTAVPPPHSPQKTALTCYFRSSCYAASNAD